MKAALGLGIVFAIGGLGVWVVQTINQREQLRTELIIQQSANDTHIQAVKTMEEAQNSFEVQVKARDTLNRKQKIKLRRLQDKLDVELSKITPEEKTCLVSSLPTPVIEFLRQGKDNNENRNIKNLP